MDHKKNNNISQNKFSIDKSREFAKALQYHQSGQLQKAGEIYKKILVSDPNHSDSIHLLGVIAHQSGKIDIAVNLINKAIQCNPHNPLYYNNLGNSLKEQGKLTEAISCFQKALEIKPDYVEAYNNMGNALNGQGNLNEAITFYLKALEIKPDYAEAHYNLGTTFRNQCKLTEAISCFQKALEIKPDHAEAYNNMGTVFKDQGRLTEAVSCLQKALEIRPAYAIVHYNLGTVFEEQGKMTEAISSYRKALEIKPDYARAHYNLGTVLKDRGELTEAISCFQKALDAKPDYAEAYNNMGSAFKGQGELSNAISFYQKALKVKPNFAEPYNNMGAVFKEQGRLIEAISCFQKALKINPDLAESHNNIGAVFKNQGRLTEAISCYQRALEIKPDYAEACYNMGNAFADQGRLIEATSSYQKALELKPYYADAYSALFHQLQQTCDWRKLEGMTAKLDEFTKKALDNGIKSTETPFASLARYTGPSRNFAVARSWSSDIDRVMPDLKMNFSFDDRRSDKAKKLIIGYLSNDFRDHAMAHLTLGLYGLHNRDEFKVFCYSYGEDDGSYYSMRIRQDCDKFVDLRNLDHADAARRIYKDKVDILVDLKGYLRGGRLEISAYRPAPVQVRYLGLPCTTGAGFFDYIITDRIVMPEDHARYYSENFVYLPHCYQINDHTQKISNRVWKKAEFGLPENSLVFCSFNQGYKIETVMFDNWMKVLRQVPESALWLQRINGKAEENLRREAEARGVKPSRLVFAEKLQKCEHLARLRLADVALDTRIVNGAITTSDALWAGVPVITMQGSSFASRMSSSILNAIGLPELITHTLEGYESLARDLAHNPDKLQMLRQKLVKNRLVEPLFDTPGFTRNLEKAYKKMWEIFIAGQRPGQIEIVDS